MLSSSEFVQCCPQKVQNCSILFDLIEICYTRHVVSLVSVCTRQLRSTDTAMCVVRRSNNSFGDRCFAAAGPCLWNTLPVHLRQCDSLEQFKRLLKTHPFGVWDRGTL